eukprot:360100_1
MSDILYRIWIADVCILYVLCIIQLFGCYRFYSMRNLLIIQKRYPKMIMAEALVFIVWTLVIDPLWINRMIIGADCNYIFGCNSIAFTTNAIGWSGSDICVKFLANIEAARLWLVNYNLHYLHSSKNQQWKSQIDESFAEKDWYLKNRKTYGNKRYIVPRALLYWLVSASIVIFLFFTLFPVNSEYYYIFELIDSICISPPVLMMLYLYYKCPKYKIVSLVITVHLGILVGSTPSLLSTIWITHKISKLDEWYNADMDSTKINDRDMMMQVVNSPTEDNSIEKQLYQTLQNEDKFEMFIQFMYREFSSESILCFVEFVQFKKYLTDFIKNNDMNNNVELNDAYIDSLYETIPKSSIVFSQNYVQQSDTKDMDVEEIEKYADIAHMLTQKYIAWNSEFEVNIPAKLRMKYIRFDQMHWEINKVELVNVFDELIHEMFLFIRNSFIRFQK